MYQPTFHVAAAAAVYCKPSQFNSYNPSAGGTYTGYRVGLQTSMQVITNNTYYVIVAGFISYGIGFQLLTEPPSTRPLAVTQWPVAH